MSDVPLKGRTGRDRRIGISRAKRVWSDCGALPIHVEYSRCLLAPRAVYLSQCPVVHILSLYTRNIIFTIHDTSKKVECLHKRHLVVLMPRSRLPRGLLLLRHRAGTPILFLLSGDSAALIGSACTLNIQCLSG